MEKGVTVRIGFISTQFSGIDNLSVKASKWSDALETAGHDCFWFGGRLDRDPDASMVVPLAHPNHPGIKSINARVFGKTGRDIETTEAIHRLRTLLKAKLHQFIARYRLDILVVANAVTVPMNIPLGLAITETLAETNIPTIAYHHDFNWGKDRFTCNGISDYLQMAFPPKLPNIEHVVINSASREEFAHRYGISSTVISNEEALRDRIELVFKNLLGGLTRLEAETACPGDVIDFRPSFAHRNAAVL